MNKNTISRWLVPTAFGNIYILWGLTYIAIAYGLKGFPPFILSGLRFLVAGLLIFSYLRMKGEKAGSLISWRKNTITGILILTGGTGLVAWGERFVSAPEAAIAVATGPLWFIAIDRKNWQKYFADKWIPIGLLLGFLGLVLFLGSSVTATGGHAEASVSLRITAFAVLVLSSVSWVLGSLHSKNNPAGESTFMNIAQQLITAGVAAFVVAAVQNEGSRISLSTIPLSAWLGLVYLIFFGSVTAYISYIWLLSVRPAPLVSTHTYVNPIVTVIAGALIGNEMLNGNQLLGLFIILGGVLLTNISKYFRLTRRSKVKVRRTARVLVHLGKPYQYGSL